MPETALAWSVEQHHLRRTRLDRGDAADQAVAADHRIVDVDAVAAADVDPHARAPDRRRARDHPAGDELVGRSGKRGTAIELDQLAQLGVLLHRLLVGDGLRSDLGQLALEAAVFALGVKGLVEPVDQVAGRLQGAVCDALNRAEDRADAALQAVGTLPVGDRQQHEGADDQQGENRPTAAYLLSIHGEGLSFGACGEGDLSKAPGPGMTLPVERASGSRREGAVRVLAAARRHRQG